MPIGGIGTGTISLTERGSLEDWGIMNRPAKGFNPTLENRGSVKQKGPKFTEMSVAHAETPEGPYKKYNGSLLKKATKY